MSRPFEHGGNIHQAARVGKPGASLTDFSANINPLGLSPLVRRAIEQNIDQLIHYPDPEGYELRQQLAKTYALDWQMLTLGNGAAELLYVLCHTLRPQKALILAPSFSEYERAARACGAKISYHTLSAKEGFQINLSKLLNIIVSYDILFLCNPNNPTGVLMTIDDIESILAAAQKNGAWVVVDESFLDFLPDSAPYAAKPLLHKYDHLFVLHSLTKFYAIPGLRLGFSASNPLLAKRLEEAKDPWNVNLLAQAAGLAALQDLSYQENSRRFLFAAKQTFSAALQALPALRVYPPSVNFILADTLQTGLTAREIKEYCFREGFLIRDCSNYPGLSDYYIRFAIKKAEQNENLIIALKKIFSR